MFCTASDELVCGRSHRRRYADTLQQQKNGKKTLVNYMDAFLFIRHINYGVCVIKTAKGCVRNNDLRAIGCNPLRVEARGFSGSSGWEATEAG